jgi:chemotaxis protein methyltransferase CheR
MEIEIKDIVELINESQGTDISVFDKSFLVKSIESRRSLNGNMSLNEYYSLLSTNWCEVSLFIDSLRIAYSEFFRNPLTFSCIEQLILPALYAKKSKEKGKKIRIWSAACAAGQESYSLAILLDEMRENLEEDIDIRIFATDINEEELAKAEQGIFNSYHLNKVTQKRLQTYFVKNDETYKIAPSLKKYLDFSYFDLLSNQRTCPTPSIYGDFDIVMCCNLLFYYKPESRKRIIEKISNTVASGGYLITGETERDILVKNNYKEVFEASAIFRK